MKEKTKSALIELLRAVVAALVAFATCMMSNSCGSTTRAVISNRAEQTTTSVTITTNNPTSWTVSPDTEVQFNK